MKVYVNGYTLTGHSRHDCPQANAARLRGDLHETEAGPETSGMAACGRCMKGAMTVGQWLASQKPAICAVCAPGHPNAGPCAWCASAKGGAR